MNRFFPYTKNGEILLHPIGTLLAILVVICVGVAVSQSRLPRHLKRMVYWALAFRVLGSIARFGVLFGVYAGSGDARDYYRGGLIHAAQIAQFDFGPLFDPANWWQGRWHGTQFVYFPSSFVAVLTGESMLGSFIIFSLFAFAGLCCFVVAFHRCYPQVPIDRYARWVWFFPALWYWPSSIGKEAIVLLGMGLALMGYVGSKGRVNWLALAAGVFLVFAIRPQVAAVVLLAMLVAHWLSLLSGRWTLGNSLQALALIGLGAFGINAAMQTEGVASFDVEGVQSYISGEGGRQLGGDSALEAPEVGLAGIPFALINILIRPFPWEARNAQVLITCIEILAFWFIVWKRRHRFVASLRHWRKEKVLRVAIPFIIIYAVSLGMVLSNMGIIARQRIFLFPFLFLLVEAVPRAVQARVANRVRRENPRRPRAWAGPRALPAGVRR